MQSFFRNLTIKAKLIFIMVLTISSIIFIQSISLYELWHDLNINKAKELKQLSQVAHSIIIKQDQAVLEGRLTQSQAKENSKSLIADLTYGNDEYFFIFDDNYSMVMHPIKPALNGENLTNMSDAQGKYFFKEMIAGAISKGDSLVKYVWPRAGSKEPIDKMSFAIYYPKWGWGVATGVYTDDIWAVFSAELWQVLQFTVLIFALTALLIFYTSKSILQPLLFLEHKMIDVCKTKDLSIRANLTGGDELTDMANAFDEMLGQFHSVIYNMRAASEQVSSSSTELSAITAQTSSGMDSQRAESHQVATAMEQMSTTVHEVAVNITNAATASHSAAQASVKCNDVLKTSNHSVVELSEKINEAEELIQNLETRSQDISSILSVITGIAEQTNLLALNAAIEAARAGEQGRGFAVVADEVRSLSSRTHESTNEINNVISLLQSGSKAAVAAMNESKKSAEIVVNNAEKSAEALAEITQEITKIDDMTNEIASASEQQTVVAEEINSNINNISQITDESSIGAMQTAQSSEELASLANDLQNIVQQFKVSSGPLSKGSTTTINYTKQFALSS